MGEDQDSHLQEYSIGLIGLELPISANRFKTLLGLISGKSKEPDWIQVDLSVWENMTEDKSPVAFLSPEPTAPPFNDLSFTFPEDEDNFGFAIVRLRSGALVAFISDPGSPVAGTGLYGAGTFDNEGLIQEVKDAFNLKESNIMWTPGQPMDI
ncbi:hypothetical protein ACWC2K_19605 [Streptomyces chattanoogensis]